MMQRKISGFTLTPTSVEVASGLFRPAILALSHDGSAASCSVWEDEKADPCCESQARHLAAGWLEWVDKIDGNGRVLR